MTRLIYKIKDGVGEIREHTGEGPAVCIRVEPDTGGYITLAGTTKRLSSGEVRFNLERAPDGDYSPTLDGESPAVLEPIRKLSGRVFPLSTPDSTVRRLLVRTEACEERIEKLEGELSEIRALLDGRIIF